MRRFGVAVLRARCSATTLSVAIGGADPVEMKPFGRSGAFGGATIVVEGLPNSSAGMGPSGSLDASPAGWQRASTEDPHPGTTLETFCPRTWACGPLSC